MTIKIHHLRPAPGSHTPKTRVGRGDASKGKTAGRGTKGSKARVQVKAGFEGGQMPIHMRLPKLKGFKNRFKVEYQVVNAGRLAELFPDGGTIGVDDLVDAGGRDLGAEPEDHDDQQHEEQLLAQVRRPERVGECA